MVLDFNISPQHATPQKKTSTDFFGWAPPLPLIKIRAASGTQVRQIFKSTLL